MISVEHIEIDTDERGWILRLVEHDGDVTEARLCLDAAVDLRTAGRAVSEYVDEAMGARQAVASGVTLNEYLRWP